jgi:hypothetical protein
MNLECFWMVGQILLWASLLRTGAGLFGGRDEYSPPLV